MSANEWSRCPKCINLLKEIKTYCYGKVPQKHYEYILEYLDYLNSHANHEFKGLEINYEDYNEIKDEKLKKYYDILEYTRETPFSVREDLSYGKDENGNIYFSFSFECSNCDFSNSIVYDEKKDEIKKRLSDN